MTFLEFRVLTVIAVFLIVLGIPALAAFVLFGLSNLCHPFHPDGGAAAGSVFCGMGAYLLLTATAAFRGLLRGKESLRGEHQT